MRGKIDEAIYFMSNIITNYGVRGTSTGFNIILAILYKEKNNDLMYRKYLESAKYLKLLELNLLSNCKNKSNTYN